LTPRRALTDGKRFQNFHHGASIGQSPPTSNWHHQPSSQHWTTSLPSGSNSGRKRVSKRQGNNTDYPASSPMVISLHMPGDLPSRRPGRPHASVTHIFPRTWCRPRSSNRLQQAVMAPRLSRRRKDGVHHVCLCIRTYMAAAATGGGNSCNGLGMRRVMGFAYRH
jgi:hypothetical protein